MARARLRRRRARLWRGHIAELHACIGTVRRSNRVTALRLLALIEAYVALRRFDEAVLLAERLIEMANTDLAARHVRSERTILLLRVIAWMVLVLIQGAGLLLACH